MKKILALLAGASVGFALFATPVAAQTIPSGLFGSINYWGVGGLSQVLNPGLAGQCLQTQGVGSAPIWAPCLGALPAINTNQFYGNVSGNFAAPVGVDVNTILNTVGYDIARPPPVESILYKSNVGPLFNWQALFPGAPGQILTSGGPTNPPFWSPTPTQSNLASICQTVGAVLYFDTPSLLWKCLVPGTSGQLLQTGGAGANPSWLTVTLATLGGVPSTRNINTSAPLSGGGALSADLTLACPTCATTTNGGPLSATAPLTISPAGVIAVTSSALTSANDTNVTVTLGGTPASALLQPVSVTIGWTGTLAIARGGTGAGTQQGALNNVMPTPTRVGDLVYWNGSNWVNLAGNNSGTGTLQESSLGVPSWAALAAGAAGQLPGTATNDNASAGNVGEIITAKVLIGSAVTITPSSTTVNVTSIPVTAGDWEIHGNVCYSNTGTTPTQFVGGISTTTATLPTAGSEGYYQLGATFNAGAQQCFPTGNVRASLAGTTTYFLTALETYTGTAPAAFGTITARRAR